MSSKPEWVPPKAEQNPYSGRWEWTELLQAPCRLCTKSGVLTIQGFWDPFKTEPCIIYNPKCTGHCLLSNQPQWFVFKEEAVTAWEGKRV